MRTRATAFAWCATMGVIAYCAYAHLDPTCEPDDDGGGVSSLALQCTRTVARTDEDETIATCAPVVIDVARTTRITYEHDRIVTRYLEVATLGNVPRCDAPYTAEDYCVHGRGEFVDPPVGVRCDKNASHLVPNDDFHAEFAPVPLRASDDIALGPLWDMSPLASLRMCQEECVARLGTGCRGVLFTVRYVTERLCQAVTHAVLADEASRLAQLPRDLCARAPVARVRRARARVLATRGDTRVAQVWLRVMPRDRAPHAPMRVAPACTRERVSMRHLDCASNATIAPPLVAARGAYIHSQCMWTCDAISACAGFSIERDIARERETCVFRDAACAHALTLSTKQFVAMPFVIA